MLVHCTLITIGSASRFRLQQLLEYRGRGVGIVPIPTLADLWEHPHATGLSFNLPCCILERQFCRTRCPPFIGGDACLTGTAAKAGPAAIT